MKAAVAPRPASSSTSWTDVRFVPMPLGQARMHLAAAPAAQMRTLDKAVPNRVAFAIIFSGSATPATVAAALTVSAPPSRVSA